MPVKFYVNEVRSGYRASYLKELADRVASGELDVEGWSKSPLPTAELTRELRSVKGVGPYAAENVLKLLGRYDGLALDSWTRAKFFRVRNNGRKTTDKKIARYYSRFNEWRGLAFWCDMTRDWLRSRGPYQRLVIDDVIDSLGAAAQSVSSSGCMTSRRFVRRASQGAVLVCLLATPVPPQRALRSAAYL